MASVKIRRTVENQKRSQSVEIKEDDDVVFLSTELCREVKSTAYSLNLGDHLADGIIRPSGITLKIQEDGQVVCDVKYE